MITGAQKIWFELDVWVFVASSLRIAADTLNVQVTNLTGLPGKIGLLPHCMLVDKRIDSCSMIMVSLLLVLRSHFLLKRNSHHMYVLLINKALIHSIS